MNLLTQSLWRDEAFSALLSAHNPLEIIRLTAGDATPPLHYLLLHFWTQFFGNSEVTMRILTLGFLLATGVVMYLIGRLQSRHAGLWLAALALTQPLLFQYGFEVRAYSQLVFLTALTIYFYLTGRQLPLFLATAGLLYTHLFGLWVWGILVVWALVNRQRPWGLLAGFVVFIPWIPSYLNFARISGNWLSAPSLNGLGETLILLGAPLLVLVLPILRKLPAQKNFYLLLSLWAIPIVGTFIFSQFKPLFLDRYLLVVVPAELVLVGLAAKERYFPWAVGLAVVIQAIICYRTFVTPTKPPFQELAHYVISNSRAGDLVVNGSSLTYFESQYYHLSGKIYSPNNDVPYYVGKVLIADSDILTSVPSAKRYWLVNLNEPGGSFNGNFPAHLIANQDFGGLKLSLYEATN